MTFDNIVYQKNDAVVVITLNRPEALNALNGALMSELAQAIDTAEHDPDVGAIVLGGSQKAFAAGADIKEMAEKSFMECYLEDFITGTWERVARCRIPVIAAVAGYALGGGCELAMMCDIIIAGDNAKFGQPEITLGIIPGIGGTQRLARAVGKAKASEMILSGRTIDAQEAERAGLVSRVVPVAELADEALKTAQTIARQSRPALMMAKEALASAFETSLAQGVRHERRLFHALFAGEDQKEGMAAFIAKRRPVFKNR